MGLSLFYTYSMSRAPGVALCMHLSPYSLNAVGMVVKIRNGPASYC